MNNIKFLGDNKLVGINFNNIKKIDIKNNNPVINFKFNTFDRPFDLNIDHINIFVDHSFSNYFETDNLIFIDHHLVGEVHDINYKSNTELMINNYVEIYNIIELLLDTYSYQGLTIYMHQDLDGICSGLIFKKLLEDIFVNKKPDENIKDNLKIATVFGKYGDIDPSAKLEFADFCTKEKEIDIYDKKFSLFAKKIGRFMKATRGYINNFNGDEIISKLIDDDFNLKMDKYKINSIDIKKLYTNICEDIINIKIFNTQTLLLFFNNIAQNSIITTILDIYEEEGANIVKNYIDPTIPNFEMNIIFKNDPTKTVYKLITINTSFDSGRSIIWKYRSLINMMLKKNVTESPWYYKITDWKNEKDLNKENINIVCYNRILNKLSFDSSNESGFVIASEIFNGGGHKNTDGGIKSIGSAIVSSYEEFINSFNILNFY